MTAVPVAPSSGAHVFVPALSRALPLLMDVPDAGGLFGMSRWASYRAAEDGTLPTLRIGHRLRVPTVRWLDVHGLAYEAVQP